MNSTIRSQVSWYPAVPVGILKKNSGKRGCASLLCLELRVASVGPLREVSILVQ